MDYSSTTLNEADTEDDRFKIGTSREKFTCAFFSVYGIASFVRPDCYLVHMCWSLHRSSREEALRHLLSQGRAKLVASTLGAEGCVVVTRYVRDPRHALPLISRLISAEVLSRLTPIAAA